MIKDTIAANEAVPPNSREMAVLKDTFPSCFHPDGSFDLDRFKEFLGNCGLDNIHRSVKGKERQHRRILREELEI